MSSLYHIIKPEDKFALVAITLDTVATNILISGNS